MAPPIERTGFWSGLALSSPPSRPFPPRPPQSIDSPSSADSVSLSLACFRTPNHSATKARFIGNIARYFQGPNPSTTCTIGLLGTDGVEKKLWKLQGKTAGGRPFVIKRLSSPEQARDCDIAYIARSQTSQMKSTLDQLRGYPVMTISDIEGFANSGGGQVGFSLRDDKVRMSVNLDELKRSRLKASSQWLKHCDITSHAH